MSETSAFTTSSPEQTKQLAAMLAKHSAAGDCITLTGDLGAGKTCFAQGFIAALTGEANAQSPTFLLIKEYEFPTSGSTQMLYHMDLYRMEHESELLELGLDDYLEHGLCLIEWPSIAENYLPEDRLDVGIELIDAQERKITFFAKGCWQKRLNNIHLAA